MSIFPKKENSIGTYPLWSLQPNTRIYLSFIYQSIYLSIYYFFAGSVPVNCGPSSLPAGFTLSGSNHQQQQPAESKHYQNSKSGKQLIVPNKKYVIQYKSPMIGQCIFYYWWIKMYTNLSLGICIAWRHFWSAAFST